MKRPLTCLPYPGAKSRALPQLAPYLIRDFDEYREPFFGGGSVGLWLMQRHPKAKYWINDLHYPVFTFWKTLKERPQQLVSYLLKLIGPYKGRPDDLYDYAKSQINGSDGLELAGLFWMLTKMSFGGIGTYWNISSTNKWKPLEPPIINLLEVGELLSVRNVLVTNVDYSHLLENKGRNTFLFLDAPYMIKKCLYGNKGRLHRDFDHRVFAMRTKACGHRWCVTYNDLDEIRHWFADFYLWPLDVLYTLGEKRIGQELIITNYDYPEQGVS